MSHNRTKEIAAAKREPFHGGDSEPSELSALFQELEMEIGFSRSDAFFEKDEQSRQAQC